jgi:hypothetical protein
MRFANVPAEWDAHPPNEPPNASPTIVSFTAEE